MSRSTTQRTDGFPFVLPASASLSRTSVKSQTDGFLIEILSVRGCCIHIIEEALGPVGARYRKPEFSPFFVVEKSRNIDFYFRIEGIGIRFAHINIAVAICLRHKDICRIGTVVAIGIPRRGGLQILVGVAPNQTIIYIGIFSKRVIGRNCNICVNIFVNSAIGRIIDALQRRRTVGIGEPETHSCVHFRLCNFRRGIRHGYVDIVSVSGFIGQGKLCRGSRNTRIFHIDARKQIFYFYVSRSVHGNGNRLFGISFYVLHLGKNDFHSIVVINASARVDSGILDIDGKLHRGFAVFSKPVGFRDTSVRVRPRFERGLWNGI